MPTKHPGARRRRRAQARLAAWAAPLVAAVVAGLAAPPATASSHSYYHHRYHPYHGHHSSYRQHSYYPRHRYSYARPYHYGRSYHHGHGYHHGGLIGGILHLPVAVLRALFGHPHHGHGRHHGHDGHEGRHGPRHDDEATVAPKGGPEKSGAVYYRDARRSAAAQGGWARLAAGDPTDAQRAFAQRARNDPQAAGPKVGFALASAAGGDLERGVWAMRRALRIDPEGVRYVGLDGDVHTRVADLVARYEYADEMMAAPDAAFMRAALHYLLDEDTEARSALEDARAGGDQAASTFNLERLLAAAAGGPEPAAGNADGSPRVADAPDGRGG